jgi:hypothetical protein
VIGPFVLEKAVLEKTGRDIRCPITITSNVDVGRCCYLALSRLTYVQN